MLSVGAPMIAPASLAPGARMTSGMRKLSSK
jgi:hypothetical protein